LTLDGTTVTGAGIANAGTVAVSAGAALTLAGETTISGGTIIDNGLIDVVAGNSTINDGASLSGGAVTVQDGATLTLDGVSVTGTTITDIMNPGAEIGTLILQGGTTISDSTIIDDGLIEVAGNSTIDDGSTVTGGDLTVADNVTLTLDDVTVTGTALGNAGTIAIVGDSTFTDDVLTHSGNGTLQVGENTTLTLAGGAIHGGTVVIDDAGGVIAVTAAAATIDQGASIAGGALTVADNVTLTLNGVTVTGTTVENAGAVRIDEDQQLAFAAVSFDNDDGLLSVDGTLVLNAGTSLSGGDLSVGIDGLITVSTNIDIDSAIDNDGTIEITSLHALTLSGPVGGEGSVVLEENATLVLAGSIAQTVQYVGDDGSLLQIDTATFGGSIEGLSFNDRIDLRNINYDLATTTAVYVGDANGGTLTVFDDDGNSIDIELIGDYRTAYFHGSADGDGRTMVTLVEFDDAPVIASADEVQSAAITEAANTQGSPTADARSGTIGFTDVDLTDRPTASITLQTATWLAADSTDLTQTFAVIDLNALKTGLSLDPADDNANSGSIGWTYSLADGAYDFLGADETATIVSTVTLDDNHGGSDTSTITIVITGRNDRPVITAINVVGAVIENAEVADNPNTSEEENGSFLTDAGSVSFTDADTADLSDVSIELTTTATTGPDIPEALSDALAEAVVLSGAIDGVHAGTVDWSFALDDGLVQYLAKDETVTATYTITVQDDSGDAATDTATRTVTVTITGTNDRPVITAIDVAGAVTENTDTVADNPNSGEQESGGFLTDTGSISFTDTDTTDLSDATVALTNTTTNGPAIPTTLAAALAEAVVLSGDIEDANAGTVDWSFALDDDLVQYLAQGETVTATYTITVQDDSGDAATDAATRTVTVTITGTNDQPEITADDIAGAVIEDTDTVADNPNTVEQESGSFLTDTGSISFTDTDTTDLSDATVTLTDTSTTGSTIPQALGEALAAAVVLSGDIDNVHAGTVDWTFALDDSLVQYLRDGETITATYTISVQDDSGVGGTDTATQTITLTITGTNDAPTIVSANNPAAQAEAADASAQNIAAISGTLIVSDIDIGDTLTGSVTGDAVARLNGSTELPGVVDVSALIAAAALTFTSTATSNGGERTLNWSYDPDAADLDFLSAGDSLTITYTAQVNDGHGNIGSQPLVITITGTNDEASFTLLPSPGDSSGATLAETNGTLVAEGTGSLFDLDITDTVQVSVVQESPDFGVRVFIGTTPPEGGSALPGDFLTPGSGLQDEDIAAYGLTKADLYEMFSIHPTGDDEGTDYVHDGTGGTLTWEFDSAGQAFDFLAAGETLVLYYPNLHPTDGEGSETPNGDGAIFVRIDGTNDAPVLDAAKSPAFGTIDEDTSAPSGAVGVLVSSLVNLDPPSGGLDNVTDADRGALTGIAIVGVDTDHGTLWYSADNGANWVTMGSASDEAAILIPADAQSRLYYQPNADFNGTIADAITIRAWDRTPGEVGVPVEIDSTGGATAFSSATDTVAITVNSVNDAPVIAGAGGNVVYSEQAAPVAVDSSLSLSDVDSANLTGAKITISGGFVAGDVLAADTSGTSITASYDPATHVLTLSGSDTLAHYEQVLESVTFANPTNDTPAGERTVTWQVSDGAGNVAFQGPVAVTTGAQDHPHSVALGDLDGDGILDIAVANENAGTVSVLLGNGNGTFGGASVVGMGSRPETLALGDFNGDGMLDMAVANEIVGGGVTVRLGNGDGSFGASVFFATTDSARSLVAADLNADGKLDLVVANRTNSGTVSVLLGDGAGGFAAADTYSTGPNPISVVVGDFDGDFILDVVTANEGGNNLTLRLGAGDGTLGAAEHFITANANPTSIAAGDLNNDGMLDLAVTHGNSNNVAVLLNDGSGPFGNVANHSVGEPQSFVTMADVDGDGSLDLLVARPGATTILSGNGDGTFGTAVNLTGAGGGASIAVGNLDGAGGPDLVVDAVHSFPTSINVLLNASSSFSNTAQSTVDVSAVNDAPVIDSNGGGAAASISVDENTTAVTTVVASDVDTASVVYSIATGAGSPDAAKFTIDSSTGVLSFVDAPDFETPTDADGNNSYIVQVVASDGSLTDTQTLTVNVADVGESTAPVANDDTVDLNEDTASGGIGALLLDNDTDGNGDDLTITAVGNSIGGTVSLNGGDPIFTPDAGFSGVASFDYWITDAASAPAPGALGAAIVTSVGFNPVGLAAGDLDGDGYADLLVANAGDNTISVLLGNGDGTFDAEPAVAAGSTPQSITIADLDGDDIQDFVVSNYISNNIGVYIGNGDGTFDAPVVYGAGSGPQYHAFGDFNNDDVLDVVVPAYDTDSFGILFGNGDGTFDAIGSPIAVGDGPAAVVVGDLDNDGNDDVIVSNHTAGTISVRRGDGDGTFQAQTIYTVGSFPSVLALGDFNHDGNLDVVVGNGGASTVSVLLGNGDGTLDPHVTYTTGTGPQGLVVVDIDQDGNQDIVSSNYIGDSVSVLRGDGNGNFEAQQVYTAPDSPFVATAADFNNDGRIDIATADRQPSNSVAVFLNNPVGGLQSSASVTVNVAPVADTPTLTLNATPQPIANEFRLNQATAGDQGQPTITALADGGFIATWQSSGQDGSGLGIYARRFDASGAPVGNEFQVNTTTDFDQETPSVVSLKDGGLVFVWASGISEFQASQGVTGNPQDGNLRGIVAQVYDADGNAVGNEILVNTETAGDQRYARVAATENGGFVVTWTTNTTVDDIKAQRFDANGGKIDGEFQVNTFTTDYQSHSAIAALPNGGFIVTWQSFDQTAGDHYDVYAQRYDANGAAVDSEFKVNSSGANAQAAAAVTTFADNSFVVVWASNLQDSATPGMFGSNFGIYGQRYNADGTVNGGEFHVSTATADDQYGPSVLTLPDGGFLVSWLSLQQDAAGTYGIYAQRFDAGGEAVGVEFRINQITAGDQLAVETSNVVTVLASGQLATVWYGDPAAAAGQGQEAYGRIFTLPGIGVEGEPITLPLMSAASAGTDTDGSEGNPRVVLSGFPAGTTFSVGQLNPDGVTWRVTGTFNVPNLANNPLSMTLPENFSGTFTLHVVSAVTDTAPGFPNNAASSAVQDIVITVLPRNDAPTVAATGSGDSAAETIGEDNPTIAASGTLTVSDIDGTDDVTLSTLGVTLELNGNATTAGALGLDENDLLAAFTIPTGAVLSSGSTSAQFDWDFSAAGSQFDFLADGEILKLSYTIRPDDGQGGTAGDGVVTITINGGDDVNNWLGVATEAWHSGSDDALNWSLGRAPISTDDVVINGNAPVTTDSSNDTIRALTVGSNDNDVLTISGNASLTVDDTLDNSGEIRVLGGDASLTVNNDATNNADGLIQIIEAEGNINARLFNDGEVSISGNASLTVQGDVDNSGQINILDGGHLTVASETTTTNNATGLIAVTNASAAFSGDLVNAGEINVGAEGYLEVNSAATNSGTLVVGDTALVYLDSVSGDGEYLIQGGTLEVGSDVGDDVVFDVSTATADTLGFYDPSLVLGQITGFGADDFIDLWGIQNVELTGYTDNGDHTGVLHVTFDNEEVLDQEAFFNFNGDYVFANFELEFFDVNLDGWSIGFAAGTGAPTDIELSGTTIGENTAAGAVIGALSAVDPDLGDSVTFQLVNDANGLFAIGNGNLVVVGPLDFEGATSHMVTVRATDFAGNEYDEDFTIDVTDMDEGPATLTITVQTPNDFNLDESGFDVQFNGAAIQAGNSATTFTAINTENGADAKLVGDGTGFTYATDGQGRIHVTGGTIDTLHWLVNSTDAAIVDFSGFPAGSAAAYISAVKATASEIGGAAIDALMASWSFVFTGNAGNDVYISGPNDDVIAGGGGIDRASYIDSDSAVTVDMAAGTVSGSGSNSDTIASVESIRGTSFDDTYVATGYAGASVIGSVPATFNEFEGLAGNDTITGNNNTKLSYLTALAAVTVDIAAGNAASTLNDEADVGIDTFTGVNGIRGSDFDDTLLGSNFSGVIEIFEGGSGNDFIDGRGGFDRANYLHRTDDHVTAGIDVNLGDGTVVGDISVGSDTLRGIETVRGTNFADTFDASTFTASSTNAASAGVFVNAGGFAFNDFEGMGGDDIITGNGVTQIVFLNATDAVTADIAAGTSSSVAPGDAAGVGNDTFSGVSSILGSFFDDIFFGSNNAVGTTEQFEGRRGNDTFDGRGGTDRASYSSDPTITTGITVDLAAGTVDGDAAIGHDELLSIEMIRGTNLVDTYDATGFSGSSANAGSNGTFNEFEGLGGDDQITGNGNTQLTFASASAGVTVDLAAGTAVGDASVGSDTFTLVSRARGSNFADIFLGGSDNNILDGQGGNDLLDGRTGNDTLTGGGGFDTFVYASGADTVTDFSHAQGDRIDLTGVSGIFNLADVSAHATQNGNNTVLDFGNGDTLTLNNVTASNLVAEDFVFNSAVTTFLNWNHQIDPFSAATTASSTRWVLANADGLTSTVFSGADFTYDPASQLPTGGTIASMSLVVNGDQTVLQAMTDISTTLADVGGFLSEVKALRSQITWIGVVTTAAAPILFAPTAIRFVNTDNTFTEILGTDFSQANAQLTGTITQIRHLDTDGTTVITDLTGLNADLGIGAAALSAADAGSQLYELVGAGDNTLTGFAAQVGSTNIYYGTLEDTSGNDTIVGEALINGSFAQARTVNYNFAPAAVVVDLAAGTATGGAGDDTLSDISSVIGSDFNDKLIGDANVNALMGGAGNDILVGGGGGDILSGDAGFDFASYETSFGGAVTADLLTPGNNTGDAAGDSYFAIESLRGTAFNDTLSGDNANNQLEGGGGADALDGRGGGDFASYANASTGVTASLATPGTSNTGDAAGDTYTSIENLRGSAFNDTLIGDNNNNFLRGGLGADNLQGGGGLDTADYTNAAAGLTVDLLTPSNNTGEAVGDTYSSIEALRGGAFGDILRGNDSNNLLDGGAGADGLEGRNGNDYAWYQSATTSITASLANPATNTGDATGDTYTGIEGLGGAAFADILTGDANNNFLHGAGGGDTLVGGTGFDTATYSFAFAGVTADLSNPANNTGDAAGDSYSSIENLAGSSLVDTLRGDGGTNLLDGGAGGDTLDGGAGIDYAWYSAPFNSQTTGITVNLGNTSQNTGTAVGDVYISIEGIFGTNFGDTLIGDAGDNFLRGSGGADVLDGGSDGIDTAEYNNATSGVTVSLGNPASNTGEAAGDTFTSIENLRGSNFGDVLQGDSGANTLTGGGGSDTFVFMSGFGNDTISDFTMGTDDINIDQALFTTIQDIQDLLENHTTDVAGGALITIDANASITVLGAGVTQQSLLNNQGDFHLV
jgi:VCBS repeat-containing protein